MGLFKRIQDINNNDYNNKNHKWFIVSSYLFKGIYAKDRIKIQANKNEIIGEYKFYLFSIYTVVLMVNNEEVHISFTEEDVNRCYDSIVTSSTIKYLPINITKLSSNPNDWGMKDEGLRIYKTLAPENFSASNKTQILGPDNPNRTPIGWKVEEKKERFYKTKAFTSKEFIPNNTSDKFREATDQYKPFDFVVEHSSNDDLSLKQIKPQMPTVTKDDIALLKELLTKKII